MNVKDLSATLCLTAGLALAGPCESSATNWDEWLHCRIEQRLTNSVETTVRDGTIRSPSKASADPAIQTNSNSLVDQTSAPDLLGFASHIAKLDSKVAGGQHDAFSFYTTAYALDAAINNTDPLNPAFYQQGRTWRRFAVDFGREVPDDKSSMVVGPANFFGTKVLLMDHRDLARKDNVAEINSLVMPMYDAAAGAARLSDALQKLLAVSDSDRNRTGQDFQSVISAAVSNKEDSVNDLVDSDLAVFITRKMALQRVYNRISRKTQWSVNFQGKRRESADFPNEYRLEMALEVGLHPRINLTANAGWNRLVFKTLNRTENGGRAAAQGSFRLTKDPASAKPVIVYFAGEGIRLVDSSWSTQAQFKTSIPLLDGVELPISVTWANKNTVIDEANVIDIGPSHFKTKFGFTFDVSKLMSRLTK